MPPEAWLFKRTDAELMSRKRLLYLVALLSLAVAVYSAIRFFDIDALAKHESALRALIREHPWQAAIAGLVVYALACVPPATSGKSLAIGWLFGLWWGTAIINLGSTTTALLVFLLTRRYFREPLAGRFASLLQYFETGLRSEGPFLLFSLRLIPMVPFTLLNPLAALTSLRARTFAGVSLLGMLPGNAICAFVGASLPDLRQIHEQGVRGFLNPQLIIAFALMAAFPWVVRGCIVTVRKRLFGHSYIRPF